MFTNLDYSLLLKFFSLVLGGGTVAAGFKLLTRKLELVYQERKELREASRSSPLLEDDHYVKIYADLIETLTKQIDRLKADASVADHRMANNLTLFKDFAEKTQQALWACHEERRIDRREYRRRLSIERRKRRELEARVATLESRSAGTA